MTTKVSLIADDSVKTGTIFNGTVNSEDLNSTAGSQAVTTNTIRDGAVTFSKLQNDASNNTNRAVGTNHIQDKAVTAAKLADDTLPYLSFPLGGIVMWSGTIAQIPLGWYLCDGGTYGGIKTPNLKNRFIVGSAGDGTGTANTPSTGPGFDVTNGGASRNYTTHDVGGEDAHKLTEAEMPSHNHQLSRQSANSNVNTQTGNYANACNNPYGYDSTQTKGSDQYHENRPPYYALAYIMKCEHRAGQAVVLTTTTPTFQELRLNGPLYDQELDGGAQKGNVGDVLTSLGDGNGVRWSSAGSVPVGSVFHFAAATPPTGYLKANGDNVPNGVGTVQGVTANFAPLYAVLGSTYGAAGKLPDLRGEFIRGWDDAKGVDTGRTFGSPQADDFKSHSHPFTDGDYYWKGDAQVGNDFGGFTGSSYELTTATAVAPQGGTETRPRNVALLACIKF